MSKNSDIIELDIPKHCKGKCLIVIFATDTNSYNWVIKKDMEFICLSHENRIKDDFDVFDSQL